MTITHQLLASIMPHWRRFPDVKDNEHIIFKIQNELKICLYKDHSLHRKGMSCLLNELSEGNLKYIPTDVLRNKMCPILTYIELQNEFYKNESLKEENSGIEKIFEKCYLQSLVSLNFLIGMKDEHPVNHFFLNMFLSLKLVLRGK